MALAIDPFSGMNGQVQSACSLNQCIAKLEALHFDPYEPDCVLEASQLLAKLTANRDFLADILIDRLAGRDEASIASGYGPQAIVLSPVRGDMFLRANIWPAEHDLCFKNSGPRSFVYGIPHDHNFSFLTSGYLGPGYRSDHFEYDYDSVTGYAGEAVDLFFTGQTVLAEGKIQLYRAHRDVHSQLPPDSLSVSLNIMHVDPAQGWFDQYGFDLERREISRVLSPNSAEIFLRVAVAGGSDDAIGFAEWIGETHPSERLRLASFEARASVYQTQEARDLVWRDGEECGSRMVAKVAKQRRAVL
ncbi:MAG: transposase [Pseudomonadota bacterium]